MQKTTSEKDKQKTIRFEKQMQFGVVLLKGGKSYLPHTAHSHHHLEE